MDGTSGNMLYALLAVIVVVGLILICIRPFRRMFKICLHSGLAVVCLFFLNVCGGALGVTLGVNATTLLTATLLGLPGIATMLILKLILRV